MVNDSKTGGGVGTNQYGVRGVSVARRRGATGYALAASRRVKSGVANLHEEPVCVDEVQGGSSYCGSRSLAAERSRESLMSRFSSHFSPSNMTRLLTFAMIGPAVPKQLLRGEVGEVLSPLHRNLVHHQVGDSDGDLVTLPPVGVKSFTPGMAAGAEGLYESVSPIVRGVFEYSATGGGSSGGLFSALGNVASNPRVVPAVLGAVTFLALSSAPARRFYSNVSGSIKRKLRDRLRQKEDRFVFNGN